MMAYKLSVHAYSAILDSNFLCL